MYLTNVELLRYRDSSPVSALCRKTFPSRTLCRYCLSANMKCRRSDRKPRNRKPHTLHQLQWHTWNPVQIVGFPPDAVVEVILKGERPLSTVRFWKQHTLDSVQAPGKVRLHDPASQGGAVTVKNIQQRAVGISESLSAIVWSLTGLLLHQGNTVLFFFKLWLPNSPDRNEFRHMLLVQVGLV